MLSLLHYETLNGDEVNAVIRGESLERSTVSDLLDSAEADTKPPLARPVESKDEPEADLGPGTLPQPG